MRRRGFVTGTLCVLSAVAGCSGTDRDAGRTASLTPAPIPAAPGSEGPTAPQPGGCPELYPEADVHICSFLDREADLRFHPPTGNAAGRTTLRLRNESERPFVTETGRWRLARIRTGTATERWTIVARGTGRSRVRVAPGETVRWVFSRSPTGETGTTEPAGTGSSGGTERETVRIPSRPPPGRYAFSVVGHHGEQTTAVLVRFAAGTGG